MANPRANAKRHVHTVKLTDYKNTKAEEGAIDIVADDGTVFHIPAPETWDEDLAAIDTPVESAKALLGDDYDAFIAAGGTSMLLVSIIRDIHGATVGESAASSSS